MKPRYRRASRIAACLAAGVMAATTLAPMAARAQPISVPPDVSGHDKGDRNKAGAVPAAHPRPTLPTAARVAWPRLDPGSIVCRTRDDLRLHAQVIQARSDGTPYAGTPPDCRILGQPTPIDIVNRESLAATEVKLKTPDGGIAWTDTWLPANPPR